MPRKFPVLLLHGFTSHQDAIALPRERLEAEGFRVETPVLRGHMGRWQDLKGVGAKEWYLDAKEALEQLHDETGAPVGLAGFSMGGLVALELASSHPHLLRCLFLAAPALKFCDPLAPLAPLLAKIVPVWPAPNTFNDKKAKKALNTNYKYFPTDSFASLYRYSLKVQELLPQVTSKLMVLHSLKDAVIDHKSARMVLEKTASPEKSVAYLKSSGHELFMDSERELAAQILVNYFLREDK